MKLGRILSLAAATAGLVLIGTESRAAPISLPNTANNLAGSTVTFGPPTTTFSFLTVTASGTGGALPVLSAINVLPLSPIGATSNGVAIPPFGFQLIGSSIAAAAGQTADLNLQYTVTSSANIVQLVLSAAGGASGGGAAVINETITNNNTSLPDGTLQLVGGGTVMLTLNVPSNNITITKDINVQGGSSGTANYSQVSNTVGFVVPEPASVVMLGCGLVGAFGLGLRRTKKMA